MHSYTKFGQSPIFLSLFSMKSNVIKFVLLLSFSFGIFTFAYSGDCNSDSDCGGYGCECGGYYLQGTCYHGGEECCVCLAGGRDQ